MGGFPVHACTDITGFGLLGHLAEMVVDSEAGITIHSRDIPVIPEAMDLAAIGLVPGGTHRNREFRSTMVDLDPQVGPVMQDILYDPQTSGGLLICVDGASADALLDALVTGGVEDAAVVGEVLPSPVERIVVT